MKIEVEKKRESFKSVIWSAMDGLRIAGTFEVPYSQLGYMANLVHYRNKEGRGRFKVVTAPLFTDDILSDIKSVHVVRVK